MHRFNLIAKPFAPLQDRKLAGGYEIILTTRKTDTSFTGLFRSFEALQAEQSPASIDRWVLDQVVSALLPHIALLSARRLSISINASGESLRDSGFVDHLLSTLDHAEIPPGLLTIQIPEQSALQDLATSTKLLTRVRRAGCGVALDGFGTGQHSHVSIANIPATRVKIDGGLVRELMDQPHAQDALRKAMQLIRGLPVDSVADYVETAAVAKKLRAMGVDYAQGHVYGQAAPLNEVLETLQQAC